MKINRAVNLVKVGLYDRLVNEYSACYDLDFAKFLSAAIVNTVFSQQANPISGKAGADFALRNKTLIETKLRTLSENCELRFVLTQAVRMHVIAGNLGGTLTPLAGLDCIERLSELGILIPGGDTPTPDTFFPLASQFYESRPETTEDDEDPNDNPGEPTIMAIPKITDPVHAVAHQTTFEHQKKMALVYHLMKEGGDPSIFNQMDPITQAAAKIVAETKFPLSPQLLVMFKDGSLNAHNLIPPPPQLGRDDGQIGDAVYYGNYPAWPERKDIRPYENS